MQPSRALSTETKVESGTSQSKSETSVNLSNSGDLDLVHGAFLEVRVPAPQLGEIVLDVRFQLVQG